jgi:hypothetical protein
MSLLKKFIASTKPAVGREIEHVTLLNVVPSKPAELKNGEQKAKMCITIQLGDDVRNMYIFRDAIAGLPTFIPKGGVQAILTLEESADTNEAGEHYINPVALGVGV